VKYIFDVVLIVKGKKYRVFKENCQAVSDVVGQILMIGIVIIAFSIIALTVFSEGGAVKPTHMPHTDLQESINTGNDTIQIIHIGGDAIDLDEIKVVLSVNGKKNEFDNSNNSKFNITKCNQSDSRNVFMLGDCITINTTGLFTSNDNIEMFFIYTPSRQVIQKTVIQTAPMIKVKDVGFEIIGDSVVPNGTFISNFTVLGAQISYGGSYDMMVTAQFKVGNQTFDPWNYTQPVTGNLNNNKQRSWKLPTAYPANTSVTIYGKSWQRKASGNYSLDSSWQEWMTVYSTGNSANLIVL
jgi:archaeal type IV pilus assembly protein PilA